MKKLAIGTNHQPIASRGDRRGVPPPSGGTISTVRLSHAKTAIAEVIITTVDSEPRESADRSKLATSDSVADPAMIRSINDSSEMPVVAKTT